MTAARKARPELSDDASRMLRFRVRRHLTLAEFAAMADVDVKQLSEVVRGRAALSRTAKTKIDALYKRWEGD